MKSFFASVFPKSKQKSSSKKYYDPDSPMNEQSCKSASDFGYVLFKHYLENNQQTNCLLSPVSVFLCLSALKHGANGLTKTEFEKALFAQSEGSGNEAQDVMKILDNASDEKFLLHTTNGLFLRRKFVPWPEFESILRSDFNAIVETVDFTSMGGVNKVNNWVEKETKGKIKRIIEKPDKYTVMAIINTVYMKGTWLEQFEITAKGDFKVSKLQTVQTDLMAETLKKASYYRDNKAKFALAFLPYKNAGQPREFEMGILLPDDGKNLYSFAQYLKYDSLQRIRSKASVTAINIIMPKFKVETSINLIPIMKKMGVKLAFTDEADFSRISDVPTLQVSEMLQKCFIDVDEKGTEAAAATAVNAVFISGTNSVTFDATSPFIFFIRHRNSGIILFSGCVTDPTA